MYFEKKRKKCGLRVIAGDKKGRRLMAPEGLDTRPTSDKVKEALFSIIQFELDGADFLDLFAGSGQMGIEALSRGANHAVFVDSGKKPCECIRQNLASTGLLGCGEIVCRGVPEFLSSCSKRFDIVFMDPPYSEGLIEPIFESVTEVAREGGVIICEIPCGAELRERINGFTLRRRYRYGKTELALYRKENAQTEIY